MKKLLTILMFIPVIGQLLRLPLVDRMGVIPTDLFLIFVLIIWGLNSLIYKKKKVLKILFWPTLAFFSWALISLIYNIGDLNLTLSETLQSSAYYFRYLCYFLLIFVFYNNIKPKDISYWKNIIYFSAFLLAIIGFLQLKYFPSFYDLRMDEQGWDPHIGRLLSTWFDPNYIGGYFVFVLSLLGSDVWQLWKNNQKTSNKFFILSIVFFTLLIALVLTYSRSSYLAFLVAGFVFALLAEKRLILIGAILIIILLVVSPRMQERVSNAVMSAQALFTQTEKTLDPTSRLRVQSWKVGWEIFKEKPITGTGFNTLKKVQKTK